MINNFKQILNKKSFLIMAHRGVYSGNIIENTIESIKLSFLSGADIAEIDVIESKDQEFYLFHTGMEKRNFDKEFNILTLDSKSIDNLKYINNVSCKINKSPEKLSVVLEMLKGDQIVNIDRSWEYWNTLLPYLDNFNKIDNILLKSPIKEEYLEVLDNHNTKYMYMGIIKSFSEYQKLKEYNNINLVGVEIIAKSENDELYNNDIISQIKKDGLLIMINSENLDDDTLLFADINDKEQLLNKRDVWKIALDKGIDIIQTDFSWLLNDYRNSI